MSGLEKILEQINSDAEKNAADITAQAKKEAQKIADDYDIQAKKEAEDIREEASSACKDIIQRSKSAADLHKRQTILKAKQELISQVLNKAHKSLLDLNSSEYFALIIKMIEQFSQNEKGTILFNQRDLDRMPKLFSMKAAKASSGNLKIDDTPRDIDGGFVLCYGGIEENCSFKALFESNEEFLQDKVHRLLFE